MEQQSKIKFLIDLSFAISVGLIIYFCVKFLLQYFLPFIFAALIAWLVHKPSKLIARKLKIKSEICAVVLALIIFIIFATIVFFCVYRGTIFIGEILNKMPKIVEVVGDLFDEFKERLGSLNANLSPKSLKALTEIENIVLETLGTKLTSVFSSFAAMVAKKAPTYFLSILVTLVASCYLAKDFERFLKFFEQLFGEKIYKTAIDIKEIFSTSVWKIIKGYIVILAVTFFELVIGFLVIGIDRPYFIAFVISLVDLLPIFGTGTVLIPWGLLRIFLGFSDGFAFLIFYIIITLVRNFIEPKIIGKQMGINPLFTLLVMFVGLKLIGFWGIIIFPMIFIVVFKYYKRQLEEI